MHYSEKSMGREGDVRLCIFDCWLMEGWMVEGTILVTIGLSFITTPIARYDQSAYQYACKDLPSLLRLSVGIEDADDLQVDLDSAIGSAAL